MVFVESGRSTTMFERTVRGIMGYEIHRVWNLDKPIKKIVFPRINLIVMVGPAYAVRKYDV